jgi:hypothetical protein
MPSTAVVTLEAEAGDTQAVAAGSTGVADPSGDITVADLGVATTAVDSVVDTTVDFTVQDPAPTLDAGRWEACAVLPAVTVARKRGVRGRGKVTAPAPPLQAGISFPREIALVWAARPVEPGPGAPAKLPWRERAGPRARVLPTATGTRLVLALGRQVQAQFRTYI